jgi:hypothetical protein
VVSFADGKTLCSLAGHPRTPWTVVWHPSAPNICASGCLGFEVRVWDTNLDADGNTLDPGGRARCIALTTLNHPIISVSFHPLGELLTIVSGAMVHVWDYRGAATAAALAVARGGVDAWDSTSVAAQQDMGLTRSQPKCVWKSECPLRCLLFVPQSLQAFDSFDSHHRQGPDGQAAGEPGRHAGPVTRTPFAAATSQAKLGKAAGAGAAPPSPPPVVGGAPPGGGGGASAFSSPARRSSPGSKDGDVEMEEAAGGGGGSPEPPRTPQGEGVFGGGRAGGALKGPQGVRRPGVLRPGEFADSDDDDGSWGSGSGSGSGSAGRPPAASRDSQGRLPDGSEASSSGSCSCLVLAGEQRVDSTRSHVLLQVGVLQCVAVRLQCVAVRLQCVAVRCSALQCVAVEPAFLSHSPNTCCCSACASTWSRGGRGRTTTGCRYCRRTAVPPHRRTAVTPCGGASAARVCTRPWRALTAKTPPPTHTHTHPRSCSASTATPARAKTRRWWWRSSARPWGRQTCSPRPTRRTR